MFILEEADSGIKIGFFNLFWDAIRARETYKHRTGKDTIIKDDACICL